MLAAAASTVKLARCDVTSSLASRRRREYHQVPVQRTQRPYSRGGSATLAAEVAAWQSRRNEMRAKIEWTSVPLMLG